MQSCLEKISIEERNKELVHRKSKTNDNKRTLTGYTKDDMYSETHPDARANGDMDGKGTGHNGHTHWQPNCNGSIGTINYSNFDTDIESGAGNNVDNEVRDRAMGWSKYNHLHPYSEKEINTELNIKEGQYFVP